MAWLFVIRIPGWRTFFLQAPSLLHMRESFLGFFGRHFRSPIFSAIEQGRDQDVLRLANPQRLKTARGRWGESPLCAAILSGRSELAIQLVHRGGSFENDGALSQAAMRGDLSVIDALLEAGKNPDEAMPDQEFSEGMTPLMWATNRKFYACMERLLEGGASVDAQAKDGRTAAMFTLHGQPEDIRALEILCRYKPDITLRDWRGRNLVDEAIGREKHGGNSSMRLLLERHYPSMFEQP